MRSGQACGRGVHFGGRRGAKADGGVLSGGAGANRLRPGADGNHRRFADERYARRKQRRAGLLVVQSARADAPGGRARGPRIAEPVGDSATSGRGDFEKRNRVEMTRRKKARRQGAEPLSPFLIPFFRLQPDFPTLGGGLIDCVEDTHEHHAVLGGGDARNAVADTVHEVLDFPVEQPVEVQSGVAGGLDVDEHLVHIREEFDLRVDTGAGFGAEQFDIAGVLLDVEVEGGFDVERHAVVKANQRRREILDRILEIDAEVVLGYPALLVVRAVVAEVIVGHAVDRDRLRATRQIAAKVDDVHAQIDQRTAAGIALVAEPAARTAAPAEVGRFGEVDVAHGAGLNEVAEDIRVVAEPAHETDHQQFAVALGGFLHGERLRGVHRHRFFAQDVTARVQRGDGRLGVRGVPGADGHRVELLFGEHLVVILVGPREPVDLRVVLRFLLVDVAHRDQFDLVRERLVPAEVRMADVAGADDADA